MSMVTAKLLAVDMTNDDCNVTLLNPDTGTLEATATGYEWEGQGRRYYWDASQWRLVSREEYGGIVPAGWLVMVRREYAELHCMSSDIMTA